MILHTSTANGKLRFFRINCLSKASEVQGCPCMFSPSRTHRGSLRLRAIMRWCPSCSRKGVAKGRAQDMTRRAGDSASLPRPPENDTSICALQPRYVQPGTRCFGCACAYAALRCGNLRLPQRRTCSADSKCADNAPISHAAHAPASMCPASQQQRMLLLTALCAVRIVHAL